MSLHKAVIHDARTGQWLCFRNPDAVVTAWRPADVMPALRRVEHATTHTRKVAAGFICYEAAPAFDAAFTTQKPREGLPLLWFGLYDAAAAIQLPAPPAEAELHACVWTPSVSQTAYSEAISSVKRYLETGYSYQVNYTLRLRAPFRGNAWELFLTLAQAQQAEYAAYIDTGRFAVCSASPEMFFQLDGQDLVSRPMKGTAPRGLEPRADTEVAKALSLSEKNRAENVMIVDMIRNDLGRVALPGTVRVPSLFETERYPTVWQMTSTVTAQTDAPITQLMAAVFPCASITGAPKAETMRIIRELETAPRGLYTGCIGFITGERRAQFNVAIRTALVDREQNTAEYGTGGGIVWDSMADAEYAECLTKARVLSVRRPKFSLLETMLWTPAEGLFLLEQHMRRLSDSATYFGIPVDSAAIARRLTETARQLTGGAHKVRLLVDHAGHATVQTAELDPPQTEPVRLRLAPTPVNSADLFLYHKTTHRDVYEQARAAVTDCDDALLWNEQGEITESCIANVVAELNGELRTPPLSCGLLGGTFRSHLIETGQVVEAPITRDELPTASRLFLINSVRKWRDAVLLEHDISLSQESVRAEH